MNTQLCDQVHGEDRKVVDCKYDFLSPGVIEVPIDVPWDQSKSAVRLNAEPVVQYAPDEAAVDWKSMPEVTFQKVQMGYQVWIPSGVATCPHCEQIYETGHYQGITWWEWRRKEDTKVVQPVEV